MDWSCTRVKNAVLNTASNAWEKGCIKLQMITALFFRCIGWLSSRLANRLEGLSGHIGAIYLRIKTVITEESLRSEIEDLRRKKTVLEARVEMLFDRTETSRVTNDRLNRDIGDLTTERDRVIHERPNLVLGKAFILNEQDRLQGENQLLKKQRYGLQKDLDVATKDQKRLENANHIALQELKDKEIQLEQLNDYHKLNQVLEKFRATYPPIADGQGTTQLALKQLISHFKAHRESLHQTLEKAIQDLPEDELARVPLKAILRISKEETNHLEDITKTFGL